MEKDKLLKYVNNRVKLILLKNELKTAHEIFHFFREDYLFQNFFKNLNDKELSVICFLLSISFDDLNYEKYYETIVSNIFRFDIADIEEDYTQKSCEYCGGDGTVNCNDCDSSGESECSECNGDGTDDEGDNCGYCDGDGEVTCDNCGGQGNETCYECDGTGSVDEHDEYEIRGMYYISYDKNLMDKLLLYDEDERIDSDIIYNKAKNKSIMVSNYRDQVEKSYLPELEIGDYYLVSAPH